MTFVRRYLPLYKSTRGLAGAGAPIEGEDPVHGRKQTVKGVLQMDVMRNFGYTHPNADENNDQKWDDSGISEMSREPDLLQTANNTAVPETKQKVFKLLQLSEVRSNSSHRAHVTRTFVDEDNAAFIRKLHAPNGGWQRRGKRTGPLPIPPPPPISPGCWWEQVKPGTRASCKKAGWTLDLWGAEHRGASESEEKCLARKPDHDNYCGTGSDSSHWTFVRKRKLPKLGEVFNIKSEDMSKELKNIKEVLSFGLKGSLKDLKMSLDFDMNIRPIKIDKTVQLVDLGLFMKTGLKPFMGSKAVEDLIDDMKKDFDQYDAFGE